MRVAPIGIEFILLWYTEYGFPEPRPRLLTQASQTVDSGLIWIPPFLSSTNLSTMVCSVFDLKLPSWYGRLLFFHEKTLLAMLTYLLTVFSIFIWSRRSGFRKVSIIYRNSKTQSAQSSNACSIHNFREIRFVATIRTIWKINPVLALSWPSPIEPESGIHHRRYMETCYLNMTPNQSRLIFYKPAIPFHRVHSHCNAIKL